jgi:SRSO17 transposase
VLERVRGYALAAMRKREPVMAWIVDDTGFPKKGKESVGVTRQYCGPLGKQENCRVAVSLSVTTATWSVPVAYRLYLPESWGNDHARGGRDPYRRFSSVPHLSAESGTALAQTHAILPAGVVPSFLR